MSGHWNNVAAWRQAVCSLYASQMFFLTGVTAGVTSFLVTELEQDFLQLNGNKDFSSWIVSSMEILSPVGSILETTLVDSVGRINTMKVTYSLHLIGWVITAFAFDLYLVIIGRIVISVAIGMHITAMVYIRETVEEKRSQAMVSLTTICFLVGMKLGIAGTLYIHWRWTAKLISIYVLLILLITCFVVHESPLWNLQKGKQDEAVKYLAWLRDCTTDQAEKEIISSIEKESNIGKRVTWGQLLSAEALKPLCLVTLLSLFNFSSGMEAPFSYMEYYFSSFGSRWFNVGIIAFITVSTQLIASVFLLFVAAYVDKTALMLISCFSMALSQILSIVYALYPESISPSVAVSSFCAYAALFIVRWTALWTIIMDVYPAHMRGTLSCATNVIGGLVLFAVLKEFPRFLSVCGIVALSAYYCFAAICLAIVVYFCVPRLKTGESCIEKKREDPIPLESLNAA